ncbi:unnamed protein product [Schistosoma margrebowiei]|uniref:CS domain-containing protein n=1 Tax=Schistosoma margrebowiei TaxID=48269 RepID=A0AA84Z3J7_9TREM|nr:unnamed protein product [Schistosoma margrebowiei]
MRWLTTLINDKSKKSRRIKSSHPVHEAEFIIRNDRLLGQSGSICASFEWGGWWQTIQEVFIEIPFRQIVDVKQIVCKITNSTITCGFVGQQPLVSGNLFSLIKASESTWSLHEKKHMVMCLIKASPGTCWYSLMTDNWKANPLVLDEMERNLTIQRLQIENPGMDFSSADISGNYRNGGPKFPA